jgi:hypothetical protein
MALDHRLASHDPKPEDDVQQPFTLVLQFNSTSMRENSSQIKSSQAQVFNRDLTTDTTCCHTCPLFSVHGPNPLNVKPLYPHTLNLDFETLTIQAHIQHIHTQLHNHSISLPLILHPH